LFVDKGSVFVKNYNSDYIPILNADPKTFRMVAVGPGFDTYMRDKDRVYHPVFGVKGELLYVEAVGDLHIDDVKIIFGTIFEQNEKIYYFSLLDSNPVEVSNVNVTNFSSLKGSENLLFSDGEKVFFYNPNTLRLSILVGADPLNTKILSADFYSLKPKITLSIKDKIYIFNDKFELEESKK